MTRGTNVPGTRNANRTPRFLSRGEIAEMFGVSLSTVTRWASQGRIQTIRTPGGHYRFPAAEVRRLVLMNRKRS